MSCIDCWRRRYKGVSLSLGLLALLAGCSNGPASRPAPPAPVEPTRVESSPSGGESRRAPQQTAPASSRPQLAAPQPVRTHDELRRQAALRLVAANPDGTYMSDPPPVLLAIPVLEIELRSDGSVRDIHVLRKPGQAQDTVQLAIDAVHRAAPFGDISRMPKPWKFSEVFLFDDERRFKPRTLD
ncbi:hypothetical protein [Roseateles violae]|uniref:Protein TonB n=1 Tax=Roseateles violae TaxID=3058042 RepID=A0ABT8DPL8_9BURK|nr:hypothetical protein [Pelomonas sp. PFR6]MDN3920285.1 hypothetical protein [Pelomonas sp. PFR6]